MVHEIFAFVRLAIGTRARVTTDCCFDMVIQFSAIIKFSMTRDSLAGMPVLLYIRFAQNNEGCDAIMNRELGLKLN